VNNCELGDIEDYTNIIPHETSVPQNYYTAEYDGFVEISFGSSSTTSRTKTYLIINNTIVGYGGTVGYLNNCGETGGNICAPVKKNDEIKVTTITSPTYFEFKIYCRFYKLRDYSNR